MNGKLALTISMTAQALQPSINHMFEKLNATKIESLLQHRSYSRKQLLSVNESSSIGSVLEMMKKNNAIAVPIYKIIPDSSRRKYVGILSVHDILSWAVFQRVFDVLKYSLAK